MWEGGHIPALPGSADLRSEHLDLCQDFGHGSSRIYAAMGSPPDLGFVRSKNSSMAFAPHKIRCAHAVKPICETAMETGWTKYPTVRTIPSTRFATQ